MMQPVTIGSIHQNPMRLWQSLCHPNPERREMQDMKNKRVIEPWAKPPSLIFPALDANPAVQLLYLPV